MSDWINKLFEGMDTPDGLLFGGLSLTAAFFPFFNSFLQIFPPPRGWSPWAAGTLAMFCCMAIKMMVQTYHREMKLDLHSVQLAAGAFVISLYMHYQPPWPDRLPDEAFMSMLFYAGLFGSPTFAFTVMQFRRSRQSNDGKP
jgi:hypothetical protein